MLRKGKVVSSLINRVSTVEWAGYAACTVTINSCVQLSGQWLHEVNGCMGKEEGQGESSGNRCLKLEN